MQLPQITLLTKRKDMNNSNNLMSGEFFAVTATRSISQKVK